MRENKRRGKELMVKGYLVNVKFCVDELLDFWYVGFCRRCCRDGERKSFRNPKGLWMRRSR